MADAPTGRRVRVLASATVLALALGASSCGDSSDDASGKKDTEQTSGKVSAEQAEIAKVMPFLRQRYNAADGKAFCSKLTAEGRKEVLEYAATIPEIKSKGCSPFMTELADRIAVKAKARQTPVRIYKIKVDGDNAAVTMNGGLAGIRSYATYRLAKEGGDWKLVNPISGAMSRKLLKQYR